MGEVILTMKDIDKSFPGVHALDHVNFEASSFPSAPSRYITSR